MRRLWVCLWLFLAAETAWAAPCITATTACTEWITVAGGPARSLVYRSYVAIAYVVANPSSYAYPDSLRPTTAAIPATVAAAAPGYIPPVSANAPHHSSHSQMPRTARRTIPGLMGCATAPAILPNLLTAN